MLTISGSGIMNESSGTQDFVAAAGALVAGEIAISFESGATAGNNTRFTAKGATTMEQSGGGIFFYDASSAGSGAFIINGAALINGGSSSNGRVSFGGDSTAASATFTANASTAPGPQPGGVTQFGDNSSAANATIISNGAGMAGTRPGVTAFDNASTAGNADLIAYSGVPGAEGGVIFFVTDSTGGVARVTVFGNGNLDISGHNLPGVTIGSIEGDGMVFLGANDLSVGANNLPTTFSGTIQDGDNGAGGSLTKIGSGKLTLFSANTYTGGTTVEGGTLLLKNAGASNTGTGAVHVNRGTLSGTGIIAGAAIIGDGNGARASLTPGSRARGALTIQQKLTLKGDATYNFVLSSSTPRRRPRLWPRVQS
jgi:autotransporter-associated beta strand protein